MAGGCESEHPSACLISIGCFVGNNCTNNRKGLYYWLFKFIDVCVQQYSDQVAYYLHPCRYNYGIGLLSPSTNLAYMYVYRLLCASVREEIKQSLEASYVI